MKPLDKEKPKSKKKISTRKKINIRTSSHRDHHSSASDGYRSDFEDETSQDESAAEMRKVGVDFVSERESVEDKVGSLSGSSIR